MKMEDKIELLLPSRLGWERAAMDLAASVARRMGFPPARIEDIKTAVSEATTNAIEHGNKDKTDQKVLVVLAPEGERLEINVTDRSPTPFPAATAVTDAAASFRVPDLAAKLEAGANTRGWGMFLIRSLVDEVEFSSTSRGNRVRMVLHLRNVAPPTAA